MAGGRRAAKRAPAPLALPDFSGGGNGACRMVADGGYDVNALESVLAAEEQALHHGDDEACAQTGDGGATAAGSGLASLFRFVAAPLFSRRGAVTAAGGGGKPKRGAPAVRKGQAKKTRKNPRPTAMNCRQYGLFAMEKWERRKTALSVLVWNIR